MTAVLQELRIAGLGVIDEAVLEPDAGFTVVTGETGAGKTMIVTALGLVCGGRADAASVRSGAKRAVVEARFALDPGGPAAAVVAGAGGDLDDDGTVVGIRTVGIDGRSRAHIGGRSAPVSALAELTDSLVAVHGQAEALSLLRPGRARSLLDRFADLGELAVTYRSAREAWLTRRRDLADRTGRARERAQREQMLRGSLEEIERVAPLPGEDADLVAEVRRLDDADALRAAAAEAAVALTGSDVDDVPNVAALLQAAQRTLSGASDPLLAGRVEDLRGAAAVVADVVADLSDYLDRLDADPERLATLLERQAALRGLTRRYGEDVDAVLAWARAARDELVDLDSSEGTLERLRRDVDDLEAKMVVAGRGRVEGAQCRRAAAVRPRHVRTRAFGDGPGTAASGCRAATGRGRCHRCGHRGGRAGHSWGRRLRSGRGAARRPPGCARTAGDTWRLRRRTVAGDAGAGGRAGRRRSGGHAGVRRGRRRGGRPGRHRDRPSAGGAGPSHQVIVVTHLAQVAAFATRHYVVDADADGIVGASAVRRVDGLDREAELARMLGGTDGSTARAHAAELLAAAAPGR